MSLVGNLEDLSLGDILQIISLSQKSGVLVLRCDQGTGRIIFDSGLVRAACVKGRAEDLRGLLVAAGVIDPAGFDATAARAADRGVAVEEALAAETSLDVERIESLICENVEAAILEMFTWLRGEFSFDMRKDPQPEDPRLALSGGLNAQYLAMEGMRVRDERTRAGEGPDTESERSGPDGEATLPADAIFDGTFDETASESSGAAPGESPVVFASPEFGSAEVGGSEVQATPPEPSQAGAVEEVVVARILEREAPSPPAASSGSPAACAASGAKEAGAPQAGARGPLPLVLIDPEVSVLEWVKDAVRESYARVHVFQQAEQGLARIRQYLVRGERPVVLISPDAEIDPLSGIHGLSDFVKRLKAQAPGILVFSIQEEGESALPRPAALDGILTRPQLRELRRELEGGDRPRARSLSLALGRALLERRAGEGEAGVS